MSMTLTSATSERSLWFLGTRAVILGRAPYVIEMHIPPMGSPPLHVHDAQADTFYLLEGEMAMRVGGSSFVASPGSYVAVPPGAAHTFRVTSPVPAHVVVIHDDPSFLELVEELGTASPTVQTAEEIVAAHERHRTRMIGASMPEEEAWEIVGHGPQPAPFGDDPHALRRSATTV
jgi:mannose-6-phosphate isomerase-like protein (cupin superfamily)